MCILSGLSVFFLEVKVQFPVAACSPALHFKSSPDESYERNKQTMKNRDSGFPFQSGLETLSYIKTKAI
jgi:hypothetical protein